MKKPKRVNSVSVGLALIAVVLGYAGYAFLPVMWPLWRITGIMRSTCSQGYSNTLDDRALLERMVRETRRTGLRLTLDNFRFERIPYDEETLLRMSERKRALAMKRGRGCRLRFRYASDYALPIVDVPYHLPYEATVDYTYDDGTTSKSNPLYEFFYNSCTCTSVGG